MEQREYGVLDECLRLGFVPGAGDLGCAGPRKSLVLEDREATADIRLQHARMQHQDELALLGLWLCYAGCPVAHRYKMYAAERIIYLTDSCPRHERPNAVEHWPQFNSHTKISLRDSKHIHSGIANQEPQPNTLELPAKHRHPALPAKAKAIS
jgi:hypothetical protein